MYCKEVPDKPMEAEVCDSTVVNELGVENESKVHHCVRFKAVQKEVQGHLQEFNEQVYRESYSDAKQGLEMIQAKLISDSNAPKEQLSQRRVCIMGPELSL